VTLKIDTPVESFYLALADVAAADLEDVNGARDALVRIDDDWADDRRAWLLVRRLTDYAYEARRRAERKHSPDRPKAVIAYYTAVRLQEEIRRCGLRHARSQRANG
jgi:hypothetical protein